MWDVVAIYGAGLHSAKARGQSETASQEQAAGLVKRIQLNVKVMDKSGRESVSTFERGVGDAIVTYENELLPRIAQGRPYELVYPPATVVVENPLAVAYKNADRHHVRDLADAFVAFLHREEAQRAFVKFGFRPTNDQVAAASSATFAHPPHAFTIDDLGGWDRVFAALFGPQGAWTKAVEEAAGAR